ncbi:hypothetical protein [Photorhabdus aballayi]|uniref:hypothetical protein n=1 Tax=Photorhabdus aballayi TaxID=2991723 RepID=UPI0035E116E0
MVDSHNKFNIVNLEVNMFVYLDINSPNYNLILGYCFGCNDQALRFYTGAGSVTSYTYI